MQRGEVLANGYTMHKIMDRGDYKFTSETFKLKAYSNTKCCHRCPAEKAPAPCATVASSKMPAGE